MAGATTDIGPHTRSLRRVPSGSSNHAAPARDAFFGGAGAERRDKPPLSSSSHSDPAERHSFLWLFYRNWRPTRIGRWVNRLASRWTLLGLAGKEMAVLEVRGRASGGWRSTPVVIATVKGERYLVSMLGPGSDWVKNVEAARGGAILREGGRRPVRLVEVPPSGRAPILSEYVRVATSGRHHFPVAVGAPVSEFQAIAGRYPVYRIVPS